MDIAPTKFHAQLKKKIRAAALTTTETAEWLGTNYITVYRWLHGRTPKASHRRMILMGLDHYLLIQEHERNGKKSRG